MKIFISMKVPRRDDELLQLAEGVTKIISRAGYEPFIATHEIVKQGLTIPNDFMRFVRRHAVSSDLMIVLYHPELRGGLIEIGIAYASGIPVWLCHKPGEKISSSAQGCAEITIEFTDFDDLNSKLSANLHQFSRSKDRSIPS